MTRHTAHATPTSRRRSSAGRRLVGVCAAAAGLGLAIAGPAAATTQTSALMPADPPGIPSSKSLNLTHYAQEENYWCGPAAGKMVVKMLTGGGPSAYNGATFTQTHFAGDDHMQTESTGSTSWGSGNFVRGVNRWLGHSWYQQTNSPSAATVKNALRSNIGSLGRPVAADTVEFAGGKHYNGHPVNQQIGHWIVAYGYSNSGDTVKFADPSTSVWSGVSATFSADTSTFTNNYLQSNGIAY